MGRVLHECFWAEVLYLEQKEKYLANTEQLGFGEKGKGGCFREQGFLFYHCDVQP